MATKLALWFLPFLLFFLMNGHGIGGRDLKGELQDHTDSDSQSYITSYTATAKKGENSQAYITGYNTQKEANSQAYLTGYNTRKEKDSQAYLTGYNTQEENSQAYLTGYNTKKEANSQAYLTGYNTKKEANSQAYLTGYNAKKEANSQTYLTGYNIKNEANSQAYLTGYKAHKKHNHHGQHNEPYIANNKKTTPDSKHKQPSPHSHHGNLNQLYITSYQTSNAHDANKPNYYLGGYKTSTHDSDNDFAFWSTNKAYGSDEPYITQYGGGGSNKHTQESATTQDSSSAKPYVTNYGLHSKKDKELKGGPPLSSNVDHTEAFKVGFFAMDDLYIGNIMTLQFPVEEFSHFISKKEADPIPFSTSQLPSVLQLFGVSEDSPQAMSMRGTIDQCEAGTITGETKICANSLESMLEFVNNIIGSEEKHEILTTTSPPSGAPLQKYTIMKVSEDIYAPKWVACHPLPYPYAVYYCHFISTGTRVFKVLLGGENGDKVEALGVCHLDTSDWSPDHILFKQLGFMPGEAPVCHFFPVKHLMWVPQPSSRATM